MTTWVIGGTSGIGAATAERLRKQGHNVLATGKKECDVRDAVQVWDTVEKLGKVSNVVFSAGVNQLRWAEEVTLEEWRYVYETNVFGFSNLMSVLVDTQVGGSVVAVSSDAATRPMRTSSLYCGSKAALDQTVRCLARELAPRFRVNAVAPGMTADTEMTRYIDEAVPEIRGWTEERSLEYERSQVPMKRRADPDEVARVIIHLLFGPEYQTGSIVTINGGR